MTVLLPVLLLATLVDGQGRARSHELHGRLGLVRDLERGTVLGRRWAWLGRTFPAATAAVMDLLAPFSVVIDWDRAGSPGDAGNDAVMGRVLDWLVRQVDRQLRTDGLPLPSTEAAVRSDYLRRLAALMYEEDPEGRSAEEFIDSLDPDVRRDMDPFGQSGDYSGSNWVLTQAIREATVERRDLPVVDVQVGDDEIVLGVRGAVLDWRLELVLGTDVDYATFYQAETTFSRARDALRRHAGVSSRRPVGASFQSGRLRVVGVDGLDDRQVADWRRAHGGIQTALLRAIHGDVLVSSAMVDVLGLVEEGRGAVPGQARAAMPDLIALELAYADLRRRRDVFTSSWSHLVDMVRLGAISLSRVDLDEAVTRVAEDELRRVEAQLFTPLDELRLAAGPGTTVLLQWRDGSQLVELSTVAALRYEGAAMGHCIGDGTTYSAPMIEGGLRVLSWRGPDGAPAWTWAARNHRGSAGTSYPTVDLQGPNNGPVKTREAREALALTLCLARDPAAVAPGAAPLSWSSLLDGLLVDLEVKQIVGAVPPDRRARQRAAEAISKMVARSRSQLLPDQQLLPGRELLPGR